MDRFCAPHVHHGEVDTHALKFDASVKLICLCENECLLGEFMHSTQTLNPTPQIWCLTMWLTLVILNMSGPSCFKCSAPYWELTLRGARVAGRADHV